MLVMTDKPELRALAAKLAPATAAECEAVSKRLIGELGGAQNACIYLPMPGELDVTTVIAARPDIVWHTTRTERGHDLTVHPMTSEMETHAFGYRQPVASSERTDPEDVSVWIVPGAAFDVRGNRLGHGKGYYDRLLSHATPHARFVAVTLERRIFDRIPTEAHDVTMHRIVTEDRVIRA